MNRKVLKLFKDRSKLDQQFKMYPDDKLIDICVRKYKVQNEDMKNLRKNFDEFLYEIKNLTIIIENLYTCFKNIYEPNWRGNSEFHQSCQQSVNLWRNFIDDLKNTVQVDLENYADKFPDIKRSIDKCNKKSAEFQKSKNSYESYRNSKKPDSGKIKKAGLELKNAQDQYKETNEELKRELPEFCDSSIQVYIELWSLLFAAEDKLYHSLQEERRIQLEILNQLNECARSGQYSIVNQVTSNGNYPNMIYDKMKATSAISLYTAERRFTDTNLIKCGSVWNITSHDNVYDQIKDDGSLLRAQSYHVGTSPDKFDGHDGDSLLSINEKVSTLKKKLSFTSDHSTSLQLSNQINPRPVSIRPSPPISINTGSDSEVADKEYIYSRPCKDSIPQENETTMSSKSDGSDERRPSNKKVSIALDFAESHQNSNLSARFYHQVVAKYNYVSQDEDELSLRKDDIIMILPWENEDQKEDGWLYGENVISKEKGLFPENHTCPLNKNAHIQICDY